MTAKIRRHHDQLCDRHTFCTKDNSIYPKLSTPILLKALDVLHWWHLAFHKITSLKHKFAAMFIHFERAQSSLESCTTLKLADHFTPTSCQMKWSSMFVSILCYVWYYISSRKLPWLVVTTNGEYHNRLYKFPHAQLRCIFKCLNRFLG
jgi:hypothetical protein